MQRSYTRPPFPVTPARLNRTQRPSDDHKTVTGDVVSADPPSPPNSHRDDPPPAVDAVVSTSLETSKCNRDDAIRIFMQALTATRTWQAPTDRRRTGARRL